MGANDFGNDNVAAISWWGFIYSFIYWVSTLYLTQTEVRFIRQFCFDQELRKTQTYRSVARRCRADLIFTRRHY